MASTSTRILIWFCRHEAAPGRACFVRGPHRSQAKNVSPVRRAQDNGSGAIGIVDDGQCPAVVMEDSVFVHHLLNKETLPWSARY